MAAKRRNVLAFCILAGALAVAAGLGQAAPKEPSALEAMIARHDSGRCQSCHPEIHEQWARSQHARPLMGLGGFNFMAKYLAEGPFAVARPEDATRANFPCAKCHLPQLLTADDQAASELAQVVWRDDKAVIAKLGIGCLVCHQDKAVVHHPPRAETIYAPQAQDGPHEGPVASLERSPFMASPAFCGQCHGLGPNFEFSPPVQCATLYGSYLHAYVAGGGTSTCIDCHMQGADHEFKPNFADRPATAKLYQAALPMEARVLPLVFQPGDRPRQALVALEVVIANNAGHRLPDG